MADFLFSVGELQKSKKPKAIRKVAKKAISGGSLHSAAQKLGSRGGVVGGPARDRKLSAAEKHRIALMGGRARARLHPRAAT